MTEPVARTRRAFTGEWGRVVAALVRVAGQWTLAEDEAQDAFAADGTAWASDGVPRSPGARLTGSRATAGDRELQVSGMVLQRHACSP